MQFGSGAVSGAEFAPSPSPCLLPPASSSLELLSRFVLQMAGSVSGWLIFSLSLAIPQFKLLSHLSSL